MSESWWRSSPPSRCMRAAARNFRNFYGKPHSRNHFRRALRYLHRRHAAAGKILTHCHERPSMAGTRALHRRARARHQAARLVHQPRARPQWPHLARPGFSPAGKTDLPRAARGSGEGARLEAIRLRDAAVQPGELPVHLRHSAAAGYSAAQSAKTRRAVAASRVQHRRQLHHEHELAELRRRIHDVVFLADGRAGHPQLFLRRRRHRHRGGARARHRAAHGARPSAISGWT